MFTGIVQAVGSIAACTPNGGDLQLVVDAGTLDLSRTQVGDSIAVAGACLTVTRIDGQRFSADVSRETLACTTLGDLAVGAAVNLEPALRAGDPLGGHYVTGHVDGVARVTALVADARSWRVRFEVPEGLERFIAAKGSVTIDGTSLTVNDVHGREFGVNLIPHTLTVTTLGALKPDTRVNFEVDIIARYAARLAVPVDDPGVRWRGW